MKSRDKFLGKNKPITFYAPNELKNLMLEAKEIAGIELVWSIKLRDFIRETAEEVIRNASTKSKRIKVSQLKTDVKKATS